jgi:hypothetical protein
MKDLRMYLIGLLGVIVVSCQDKEIQDCVCEEAEVLYPGQTNYLKYKFTYDDNNNLKEVQELRYNDTENIYTLSTTKQYIYSNNKISSITTRFATQNEGNFVRSSFEYMKSGDTTILYMLNQTFIDGIITDENLFVDRYFESPKDGVYFTKDILGTPSLQEYSGGNLIKVALQTENGSIVAYDTTWNYVTEYFYDQKPNVATANNAIMELLSWVPNYGFCQNNVTEIRHIIAGSEPIRISQEFTFAGNSLVKYIYGGTGRTVSFNYSCK